MDNNLTDYQIGLKGQLWINLPVTIIILVSLFLSYIVFSNFNIAVVIAIVSGLFYWRFSAAKWVKWADQNNVDHDRLYTIGKRGLLIWNRKYIEEVVENDKKPWF